MWVKVVGNYAEHPRDEQKEAIHSGKDKKKQVKLLTQRSDSLPRCDPLQ